MSLLKNIYQKFINCFLCNTKDEFSETPQGVCPNCWGHQEYDRIIRKKYKDAQISVKNKQSKYAFIQDFVVTHLNGIQLKSTVNGMECTTCSYIQE